MSINDGVSIRTYNHQKQGQKNYADNYDAIFRKPEPETQASEPSEDADPGDEQPA